MGNMRGERTTATLTRTAVEQLRLARIDMSATERRQLTNSEVITRLIETWRRTAQGQRRDSAP